MLNNLYIENKSEFLHQLSELGFTPHDIIDAAFKEGMHYSDYIVQLLT